MAQQVISEEKLIALLNSELHKTADYRDCRFTGVQRLAKPDENGCNWSHVGITCSGVPASICTSDAVILQESIKSKYNVS